MLQAQTQNPAKSFNRCQNIRAASVSPNPMLTSSLLVSGQTLFTAAVDSLLMAEANCSRSSMRAMARPRACSTKGFTGPASVQDAGKYDWQPFSVT